MAVNNTPETATPVSIGDSFVVDNTTATRDGNEGFIGTYGATVYYVFDLTEETLVTWSLTNSDFQYRFALWYFDGDVKGSRIFQWNFFDPGEPGEVIKILESGRYLVGFAGMGNEPATQRGTLTTSTSGSLKPEPSDAVRYISAADWNYNLCPGQGITEIPWELLSFRDYHPDTDWDASPQWMQGLVAGVPGQDWHDYRYIEIYDNIWTGEEWWIVFHMRHAYLGLDQIGPIWRPNTSATGSNQRAQEQGINIDPAATIGSTTDHIAGNPATSLGDYQLARALCVQNEVLHSRGRGSGTPGWNTPEWGDPEVDDWPCDPPAPEGTVRFGSVTSAIGQWGLNYFSAWFKYGWWPVFWYCWNQASMSQQAFTYNFEPQLLWGPEPSFEELDAIIDWDLESEDDWWWRGWSQGWQSDAEWTIEARFGFASSGHWNYQQEDYTRRKHDATTVYVRAQPFARKDEITPGQFYASGGQILYSAPTVWSDPAMQFDGSALDGQPGTPTEEGQPAPKRWIGPNYQEVTLSFSSEDPDPPKALLEWVNGCQLNPITPPAPQDSGEGVFNVTYYYYGQMTHIGNSLLGAWVHRPYSAVWIVCPEELCPPPLRLYQRDDDGIPWVKPCDEGKSGEALTKARLPIHSTTQQRSIRGPGLGSGPNTYW
jgi:hypothetical protein